MPLPLARSPREVALYVQLHPCACRTATVKFVSSAILQTPTGMAQRDNYQCGGCRQPREFLFGILESPLGLPEHSYGDERPSELLDPGEWLWVGMRYAALATQGGGVGLWQDAAAAVDEAAKFVRPGVKEVHTDAIPSDMGNAVHRALAAAFTREALFERANRYRQGAAMADEPRLPEFRIGRPDGLARNHLIDSLTDRVRRVANSGDASMLLDRETLLEIDALLGPNTPFDLLASYLCGTVCWARYQRLPAGGGIDDLARTMHAMGAVHRELPRYRVPEGESVDLPEELLLIIENRHAR